ncbi:hypothetical protein NVP1086O_64 [Vibrio phage 1.086.O._10N.222.51.F8]|nr:hypothetical protein NVP1086O_64 [Vibrio phage 1.086.O._10N.222.51.F8]
MSYMISKHRQKRFEENINKANKINAKLLKCSDIGGSSFRFYQEISHKYIAKAEALI